MDRDTLKVTKDGDYNLSPENKIRAIIDEKTFLVDEKINYSIKQIVCSRNYAIHSQEKERCKDFLIKEIKNEYIEHWFEMLLDLLSKMKKEDKV